MGFWELGVVEIVLTRFYAMPFVERVMQHFNLYSQADSPQNLMSENDGIIPMGSTSSGVKAYSESDATFQSVIMNDRAPILMSENNGNLPMGLT